MMYGRPTPKEYADMMDKAMNASTQRERQRLFNRANYLAIQGTGMITKLEHWLFHYQMSGMKSEADKLQAEIENGDAWKRKAKVS